MGLYCLIYILSNILMSLGSGQDFKIWKSSKEALCFVVDKCKDILESSLFFIGLSVRSESDRCLQMRVLNLRMVQPMYRFLGCTLHELSKTIFKFEKIFCTVIVGKNNFEIQEWAKFVC